MIKYIDKAAVVAEIERIKKEECPTDSYEGRCKLLWFEQFLSFLNTLKVKELWKPADGDDLPEIDREVIALLSNGKVVYAHRPQEYWDGKNIATGEVTRHYPVRYDKGNWNIPDVKWWLDLDLPKMEK